MATEQWSEPYTSAGSRKNLRVERERMESRNAGRREWLHAWSVRWRAEKWLCISSTPTLLLDDLIAIA